MHLHPISTKTSTSDSAVILKTMDQKKQTAIARIEKFAKKFAKKKRTKKYTPTETISLTPGAMLPHNLKPKED